MRWGARQVEPVVDFVNALRTGAQACALTELARPLGDADVGCVAEALRDSQITDLDLSGNAVGASGAEDLAAAVRLNPHLLRLALGTNTIADEGTLSFAAALKDNRRLTQLDLAANCVGDHGVAGLAEVLCTNQVLQMLDLQQNAIRCQGVVALVEALKVNGVLQVLNLAHNQACLPRPHRHHLPQVLFCRPHSSPRWLWSILPDLDGHQIADVGAAALGGAVTINSSLTAIDVAGNTIGEDGCVALASGAAHSLSLRELSLDGNQVATVAGRFRGRFV
jgi:Ran GTPase-activating protein (RanGAP) involved in mRNA processing and transport